MEADETTKCAIKSLVDAIQASVDTSPLVKGAVTNLHRLGYIPNFMIRMDLELLKPTDETLTDMRVRIA